VITLFTIPKPCIGHIGVIQRNAIASWARLPDVEVLLFGNDEGVSELARDLSLQHLPGLPGLPGGAELPGLPGVKCSEAGTPLVSDLFRQAHALSTRSALCYVNADIILMSDFLTAARTVIRRKRQFLMVGQRWDTPVTEPIRFDEAGMAEAAKASGGWEVKLRDLCAKKGTLHKPTGIDYFLFNRDLYGNPPRIPDFAIGRTAWDNWFIYKAIALRAPVIDATASVLAVHQNHDYAHGGGFKQVWKGEEAKRNLELAGGPTHLFTIWDASHTLEQGNIKTRGKVGLGGGIWNYRRSARSA
jgi:hypothetical protein